MAELAASLFGAVRPHRGGLQAPVRWHLALPLTPGWARYTICGAHVTDGWDTTDTAWGDLPPDDRCRKCAKGSWRA